MTSVSLAAMFINVAANPFDFRAFDLIGSLSLSDEVDAQVRQMANGRRRVVRRAGRVESVQIGISNVTRTDIAWLVENAGEVVCFRDDIGTKFFGIYTVVPRDEDVSFRDRTTVALQITSTTWSEAV